MFPKDVEERDRLVSGRLVADYYCNLNILAHACEHSIGKSTVAEIKN
jgi:hypothetical protein